MTPPDLGPRYMAVDLLGEGATGAVWRARCVDSGELVAVKVVRANLAMHARFRAHFAREVALSASVQHPRVVPVRDHGRLPDGRPFVALAYADRGSLADLLASRPPLGETLRIIDQVLDALGALHARGLVHQDLKPANVLLHSGVSTIPSVFGDAWVADLGVAGALSELTMDRRGISGTPAWMAPEQLMGRAQELGPWSDLYSVGRLLYAILGGEECVDERAPRALLEQRLSEAADLPDDVPAALRTVVRNLLHPDPRQRYDRAADVRRALVAATVDLDPERSVERALSPLLSNTTFPDTILPEGQAPVVVPAFLGDASGAPRWNRVPPGPIPVRPPRVGLRDGARAALSLLALRDTPLVAREEARERLWAAARDVVAKGRPQVVLLVGESGAGKSRIVESVARALDAGGHMEVVYLHYHDPPGADDGYRGAVQELLAPWNDTRHEAEARLARWLARDHQSSVEASKAEAAVLARWCGYLRDGETPVNAAVGLAFLYRHLDARAWRGGACIVMEDLHLCTGTGDGFAVLEALLEGSVGERPVLAMGNLSSDALTNDPALAARVAALEALGAVRVHTPRLEAEEMEGMLRGTMGLDPELARAVAPSCEGSAVFANLLLRDWAARGVLRVGDTGRFELREGESLEDNLVGDFDALCDRRIEGALASMEDVASVAAALGATALAGQAPPARVVRSVDREGLDALVATGLVRQRGRRLVFEHAGVRRAALRHLAGSQEQIELHRRLADAWAELARTTGADVNLSTGKHRLRGGQPDKAVAPLLRAARNALAEGRPTLALQAARAAVEAADQTEVRMARAEARTREAEALLELDRAAEALEVVRASREQGGFDRRSLARLMVLESRAAVAVGDGARGRELLERAASAFESTWDVRGLVDTAHGQATLFRMAGDPGAAADRYARMLRLNKGADSRAEVLGLVGVIECRLAAGQADGVEADLRRLRIVARQSGDTRNIAQSTYAAGLVHLHARSLALAERYFQTARALASTLGAARLQLACENNLGEVHRYRGNLPDARSTYARAARLAEQRGWNALASVARLNLALCALKADDHAATREEVDRVEALLQQLPEHWCWAFVGLFRSWWAAEAGEEAACQAWWSVARERGLARLSVVDVEGPLRSLAERADAHGWTELARRVRARADEGPTG